MRQLSEEEIGELLSGVSYDGQSFEAFPGSGAVTEESYSILIESPVEPEECKDVFAAQLGEGHVDAPAGYAVNDEQTYRALVVSHASPDEAQTAFSTTADVGSSCEEMTYEVPFGGSGEQQHTMSITAEDAEVPGAHSAVQTTVTTTHGPGIEMHFLTALTGNGLIIVSPLNGSPVEKTPDIAAEVVKAYTEAAQ